MSNDHEKAPVTFKMFMDAEKHTLDELLKLNNHIIQVRTSLAFFASAVAKQPNLDPAKLLADFEALIEMNPEDLPSDVIMDVRTMLASIAEVRRK